jgi:superfamily II DNA/RNA helicase
MRHITGLAKIPATLGFVEEFIEDTDRKLVIFVHHIDVGSLLISSLSDTEEKTNPDYYELAQSLKDQNIKILKLTAEFSDSDRFLIQEEFNKTNRCVMVASTLASGEGIDLQTCADAVMHERQWNPQNEDQAAPGRFRRIGQKSSVINITFCEAEGTVDEHLDVLVENKRRQFHDAMNKGEAISWNQSDIGKQLAALIVAKHNSKNKGKLQNSVSKSATLVRRTR